MVTSDGRVSNWSIFDPESLRTGCAVILDTMYSSYPVPMPLRNTTLIEMLSFEELCS